MAQLKLATVAASLPKKLSSMRHWISVRENSTFDLRCLSGGLPPKVPFLFRHKKTQYSDWVFYNLYSIQPKVL